MIHISNETMKSTLISFRSGNEVVNDTFSNDLLEKVRSK